MKRNVSGRRGEIQPLRLIRNWSAKQHKVNVVTVNFFNFFFEFQTLLTRIEVVEDGRREIRPNRSCALNQTVRILKHPTMISSFVIACCFRRKKRRSFLLLFPRTVIEDYVIIRHSAVIVLVTFLDDWREKKCSADHHLRVERVCVRVGGKL